MVIAGGANDGESAAPAAAAAQLPLTVTVTQNWGVDHPVLGLSWMDGPVLATVLEFGPRTLISLYNQQGMLFLIPRIPLLGWYVLLFCLTVVQVAVISQSCSLKVSIGD